MDCPIEKIVSTKNGCEKAAMYLQIDFANYTINSTDFPAGCYWVSREKLALFNSNLDPTTTTDANFGSRGGICENKGKYNSNVCCNYILL